VSRFHSYLNSAASILHSYKGEQPFSIFLKSFFSQNKKYGSRDRKQIGHLCYCYFRLGQALQQLPTDERILTGLFLCERHPNELLEAMRPEWNELIALPQEEKTPMFNFSIDEIFPWWDEFSEGVDQELLSKSFLIQPDLFLRIRPGQEREVKTKLLGAHLLFNEISHSCLSLENTTQLDNVIEVDREAVIQDYNSQRIAEFFELMPKSTTLSVYDCCAASGGKSIFAFDTMDNIQLTVSDLRESILANLKKRFQKAGIRNYQSFVADLSTNFKFQISNFDLIICDAPCTGSGTWSRTPEQLYYFKKEKIDRYSNLQKSILENVVPLIRKGGHLLYITCSVFKKENEDVVEYLQKEFNLKVEKMELLKGYDKKADTLFAALLIA